MFHENEGEPNPQSVAAVRLSKGRIFVSVSVSMGGLSRGGDCLQPRGVASLGALRAMALACILSRLEGMANGSSCASLDN